MNNTISSFHCSNKENERMFIGAGCLTIGIGTFFFFAARYWRKHADALLPDVLPHQGSAQLWRQERGKAGRYSHICSIFLAVGTFLIGIGLGMMMK